MAFKFEYTSEEDNKKFGVSSWVIDRERDLFMSCENYSREDMLKRFRLFSYKDGRSILKIDAKDRSVEYCKELGVVSAKWYDMFNWFTLDESMKSKTEELKQILTEAIDEYGRNTSIRRNPDIKVKITPFQNK